MTPVFAADLVTALLAGLAGSLHCIGMCGPLATVGCRAGWSKSSQAGPWLFVSGKLLSYSLLGLLAGWFGAALLGSGWLGQTTAYLSLVGGVVMILAIAVSRFKNTTGGAVGISLVVARSAMRFGKRAPVLLGIAAALLPCGLLYAMVARSAAAGAPIQGMALMQAFGVGTTPALLGLGLVVRWIPQRWSRFGSMLGEIILVLTALVLIWRGLGSLLHPSSSPPCCPQ